MFTHNDIWAAIDRLARHSGHSTSGLARKAGLDPTAFNKSKRLSPEGKPRWPSTESISKILSVTNYTFVEMLSVQIEEHQNHEQATQSGTIPVIPLSLLRQGVYDTFFSKQGLPAAGTGWRVMSFLSAREIADPRLYAIELDEDRYSPVFRENSFLILSPSTPMKKGDRVLLHCSDHPAAIREIFEVEKDSVILGSILPNQDKTQSISPGEGVSLDKVIWASQ